MECGKVNERFSDSSLRTAIASQNARIARRHGRRLDWGWIYVVAAADIFKIGVSRDVPRRVAQMQTASAQPLEIVAAEFYEQSVYLHEKDVHVALWDWRIRGEWYRITPESSAWVSKHLSLPPEWMIIAAAAVGRRERKFRIVRSASGR